MSNYVFSYNSANFGGAIQNQANLTVTNSFFVGNYAESRGGAIQSTTAGANSFAVSNSTFWESSVSPAFNSSTIPGGGAIERQKAGDGDVQRSLQTAHVPICQRYSSDC